MDDNTFYAPPHTRVLRLNGHDVVLRASEPEDRPRANAVRWSAGWVDAPTRHRNWPEADADWQARHYYREIVAEVDGVIAARVGLEAYRPPFAELVDLSVRPDYQRRGLGELLTRECQREAARLGFVILHLQTEIDNRAAHRLYTGQDFVPTAHVKMLRMMKFLDYPLLSDFRRSYPLAQYTCTPVPDATRAWDLRWHAYLRDDYLRLRMRMGASRLESESIGPSIAECDWRIRNGERGLHLRLHREKLRDLEPGDHIELTCVAQNHGQIEETGVFQMVLPPGVRVSSPATNADRVFEWKLAPGDEVQQPVVIQILPTFDAGVLWYLNYQTLSVCMETWWQGHRALLSATLPMAVPPPPDTIL